jgi:hypothetical protein
MRRRCLGPAYQQSPGRHAGGCRVLQRPPPCSQQLEANHSDSDSELHVALHIAGNATTRATKLDDTLARDGKLPASSLRAYHGVGGHLAAAFCCLRLLTQRKCHS